MVQMAQKRGVNVDLSGPAQADLSPKSMFLVTLQKFMSSL